MKIRRNLIRVPVIVAIGVLILTLIPLVSSHKTTQAAPAAISKPGPTRIIELYGALPLRFESNQGQTDSQVRYLSRNPGYDLFLTPCEAVMVPHRQQKKQSTGSAMSGPETTDKTDVQTRNVVRMRLVGANPEPAITGRDKLPGKSHYFIGNDRKHWHTDIPQYGRVAYEGVYPGIDLAFYGTNRQLEYDFVVRPGADPKKIMITFSGMDTIDPEKNGGLILKMGSDTIVHHAPKIYQEINGEKRNIKGHYVLYDGNRAGFHVAPYDTRRPLVIDPELTYSTYIGGINLDNCNGIAIDSSGHAYITGGTDSPNFPINNPQVKNSGRDVFITKLDSDGSTLMYTTYLGGSNNDEAFSIAIDSNKNVFITGKTSSSADFPMVNPVQNIYGGNPSDAFVIKIDDTGSVISYSTYHGGDLEDVGYGIAVDNVGDAYVTGYTFSTNFPTQNPYQTYVPGSGNNVFVTKINSVGPARTYSTYLCGSNDDYGQSMAVDSAKNAYVTGYTDSVDFPTAGTPSPAQSSKNNGNDAFVTKLSDNGSSLVYSTFVGGRFEDHGQGIAVDTDGNAYITGRTTSDDLPTTGSSYQSSIATGQDAFILKLNTAGSSFVYLTYLGGNRTDEGLGIAVDGNKYAYVTGRTLSSDFPTT
ncbi:MAG: SBBP repeat-containing protein, partial [Deltaproteobacteria bacterium]|nr:SBBP repeat-containing protein [Deltaproteobacteria bacterium]